MAQDEYNRGGFFAFIFSMVFSLLFFVYITFMTEGIDLKEILEEAATTSEPAVADGGPAGQAAEPLQSAALWVSSPESVSRGRKAYETNCQICHGPEGKGDGAAGKSLVPPPRDLVAGGWKKGGDSISLYNTLKNGLPGTSMVAFGHLPKEDRWAMVHYIHSITKDKPSEDLTQVEKFGASAD